MPQWFFYVFISCWMGWSGMCFASPKSHWRAQERFTIRLVRADIHDVLRLFAELRQTNIVVSDQIRGRVTLFFRHVSWEVALHWLLRSQGLRSIREGNVLLIVPLHTKK